VRLLGREDIRPWAQGSARVPDALMLGWHGLDCRSSGAGPYDQGKPHRPVMAGTFEQAKAFFQQGLAHYLGGRYVEAERAFAAALGLVPGRVSTLTNLGATRLKLGRFDEAVALFDEALAQEPDNVEAHAQRAAALAELGQAQSALAGVERALELDPARGAVWTLRGSLMRTMGRLQDAIASYEKALAHGADNQLNRYYLASLTGREPPPAAPRDYVQALFDSYADGFEDHLVEVLHYRAPAILVDELRRAGRRFAAALDLGCGTGLCGPLLRPIADRLVGVDLSRNMVEQAAGTGAYDEVIQDDLVHCLEQTVDRYDLVVAADVFIYVGALESVFAGVARVLEPGGRFCFSVEVAPGDRDLVLQPSLRYAHSLRYIRRLAEPHGFEIIATSAHPIREDQGTPIPGLFAWLGKR
jgi:predicted TPR repeat methyltransferase